MSQPPDLPPSLFSSFPWNADKDAIWVASTLLLRRNLADYKFATKLQGHEKEQVLERLKKSLEVEDKIGKVNFYDDKEMSSSNRDLLFEHFLFLHGLAKSPNGLGYLLDEKGGFVAEVHGNDHLSLHVLNMDSSLEVTWNNLAEIESAISKDNPFAFSPKFGYLTSDPAHCGTGLTVSAFLHVPALAHTEQLAGALTSCDEDEILFMGISGHIDELIGDVLVIQNNYSIGMSEESILHSVQTVAMKVASAERAIRAHLKEEASTEIMDLVSKAYGLIVHSYQLQTKEALDLLSAIRLGLTLGYVEGIEEHVLGDLFFTCRRGHLQHRFPDVQNAKELSHKRAEFLHEELKELKLSPDLQ